MSKNQMSRRNFLKGLTQTTTAAILGGIIKFVPEAEEILGTSHTLSKRSMRANLVPIASDDPRVKKLQALASSGLNTEVFGSSLDWKNPYLGARSTKPTSRSEAIAVAFHNEASSCAPYLLLGAVFYLTCVSLGVAACVAEHCN